jgi:hypothetical protein
MEVFAVPLVEGAGPILADQLPVLGRYCLDLGALPLQSSSESAGAPLIKGDRVELTVEAVDYRGKSNGQASRSEPMVLEITDESGVLKAISAADETSEKRLGEIIRRQLGIGAD